MTYFASDLHFSHRSICAFSPTRINILNLPFNPEEVREMDKLRRTNHDKQAKAFIENVKNQYDKALLEAWNDTVGFSEEAYILGDVSFCMKVEETSAILNRMHGRLYLIRGNHDVKTDRLDRWEWVKDYAEININKQMIVLSHFPFLSFHKQHKGAWSLNGHQHGTGPHHPGKALDVGMESTGKVAVNFDMIKKYMDTRPIIGHGTSDE